jgi:hypothetical protein
MDRFAIAVLVLIPFPAVACGGGAGIGAASMVVGEDRDGEAAGSPGIDAGALPRTEEASAGDADDSSADAPAPSDGGGSEAEASPSSEGGGIVVAHGNKILIYTLATGYVHASIPDTATGIAHAATAAGLVPETSADPAKFDPGGLSQYAGVVLVATSGAPFGSPGTTQIQTLIDFVRGGGGLVAIEDANHAYASVQYISLIGGEFTSHSALGPGTCSPVGNNPAVMMLPATFAVTSDEIYFFTNVNADDQPVLRCSAYGSAPRPVAWVRTEGLGRVFYTSLGHTSAAWIDTPGQPSLLVHKHVFPALLWTIGR